MAKPRKKKTSSLPGPLSSSAAAVSTSTAASATASVAHVALARQMLVNRMGSAAAATAASIAEKAAAAAIGTSGQGLATATRAPKSKKSKAIYKENASEGQGNKVKDKLTPKFRSMLVLNSVIMSFLILSACDLICYLTHFAYCEVCSRVLN